QVPLPLQCAQKWLGRTRPGANFGPRVMELVVGNKFESPGELGDPGGVGGGHAVTAIETGTRCTGYILIRLPGPGPSFNGRPAGRGPQPAGPARRIRYGIVLRRSPDCFTIGQNTPWLGTPADSQSSPASSRGDVVMKFYLIVAKGKKQGMPIPVEIDLF